MRGGSIGFVWGLKIIGLIPAVSLLWIIAGHVARRVIQIRLRDVGAFFMNDWCPFMCLLTGDQPTNLESLLVVASLLAWQLLSRSVWVVFEHNGCWWPMSKFAYSLRFHPLWRERSAPSARGLNLWGTLIYAFAISLLILLFAPRILRWLCANSLFGYQLIKLIKLVGQFQAGCLNAKKFPRPSLLAQSPGITSTTWSRSKIPRTPNSI